MDAFVHVLILACFWRKGHYAAFISTREQFEMEIYVKRASSLTEAMSDPASWIKQAYQIISSQLLYHLWWDTEGFEMVLYSSDIPGESGTWVNYRWLAQNTTWYTANVVVALLQDAWSCMYLNQDYRIVHPSSFFAQYPSG
jgi:hypothetical protein